MSSDNNANKTKFEKIIQNLNKQGVPCAYSKEQNCLGEEYAFLMGTPCGILMIKRNGSLSIMFPPSETPQGFEIDAEAVGLIARACLDAVLIKDDEQ